MDNEQMQRSVSPTETNDALMTLGEFKSQWIVLLRRQKELSSLHQELHIKNGSAKMGEKSFDEMGEHTKDKVLSIKRKRKRMIDMQSTPLNTALSRDVIEDGVDPYCCKHLRIPSSHELIDKVVDESIERWRALDQRKINAEFSSNTDNPVELSSSLPKWYEKHVRLPDQFDYASVRELPPPDDGMSGDRVISLVDPTATTSYHTELWKLFADVPTRQQLEDSVCDVDQLVQITKWYNEMNLTIGSRQGATARWDQFGLSRLRMNDRHDLPPIPLTLADRLESDDGDLSQVHCGLLRIECVRKQLRRTSTPDSNRMVLEFLGSQTLLEVHEALVELTDDEFWRYNVVSHATNTGTAPPRPDTNYEKVGNDDTKPLNDVLVEEAINSSGYFFIEDTFYVSGKIDYTTPILNWLQFGTKRQQTKRLKYLGITTTQPPIRLMADIRLYELPTRLGIRYVHVHNGDVECAVFVTDRRLMPNVVAGQLKFPIIYDIWTPSYSVPDCELCENRVSAIATATTCPVTGGHRALCEPCSRLLRLQVTSRDKIERYTVWRSQPDISAGASKDTTW